MQRFTRAYSATDQSIVLFVFDTAGQPVTGLVAADISALKYWHSGDAAVTDQLANTAASDLAALDTAHTDSGFKEITDGLYRIDLEDAVFAFGAHETVKGVFVATGTDTIPFAIELQLSTKVASGDVQAGASAGDGSVTVEASKNITAGDLLRFFDPANGDHLGAYGVKSYDSGTGVITLQDPGGLHTALTTSHDWETLIGARSADVNIEFVSGNSQDLVQGADTLVDSIWDEAQADHVAAGSMGEAANTVGSDGTGLTEAGGDGDHLTEAGGTGDQLTALASAADLATVDTVVDAIKVVTDALGSAAATKLASTMAGTITGAAATGTLSTTQATTDLTGFADDQLIGRALVVTSGAAAGEATAITDYASSGGTLTFDALTTAMADGDTFVIV